MMPDLKNPLQGVSITSLVRLLVAMIVLLGALIGGASYWGNERIEKLNDAATTYQVHVVDRLSRIKGSLHRAQNLILSAQLADRDAAALTSIGRRPAGRSHRDIHTSLEFVETELDQVTEILARGDSAVLGRTMTRAMTQFERLHDISDLHHLAPNDVADHFTGLNAEIEPLIITLEQAWRLASGEQVAQRQAVGELKRSSTLQLVTILAALAVLSGYLVLLILRSISQNLEREARTLKTLHESEANLSHAQNLANLGSYECRVASGEVSWSEQAYRIFGLDPDTQQATTQDFLDHIHVDDLEMFTAALADAKQKGQAYDVVHRVVRPNGEIRIVQNQSDIDFDQHGNPVKLRGVFHDVTELKQAEILNRRFSRVLESSLNEIYIRHGRTPLAHAVGHQARNIEASFPCLGRTLVQWRNRNSPV
jgi:PAS domain-containing protein